jgi:DNA-binding NtrC family response regulator
MFCLKGVEPMETERLLVVDDVPGMRHLVGSIATKAGYSVELAGSAAEFKTVYQRFQPMVIVLDLLIPDEDGIELLWYLHREDFDGAIVIFSGASKTIHLAAQSMAKGLHLYVADSFGKPLNVRKLRDSLIELRATPTIRTG